MNKLIIIRILVIGFFIFQLIGSENNLSEGRLEIIYPELCINLDNQINDCNQLLFKKSSSQTCIEKKSIRYKFENDTLIEFLVFESNSNTDQSLDILIDNVSINHKVIEGFLWADINYKTKDTVVIFNNICDGGSLTFYGRN